MTEIGIGLIGSGFMGKCHALAFRAAKAVFGGSINPRLELLCDMPAEQAKKMAAQFGFARATDDWRQLANDPAVDVVSITTPNKLHHEMAMAAIAAGKHVYCEKPLALTLAEACEMRDAAAAAGVCTMVGYNYIKNPVFTLARELIAKGEIGKIIHFRGTVDEDYQADPELPWTWRSLRAEAGLGALGDLGCHLISMALGIVGPVESLLADMQTVHATRPLPGGNGRRDVENEDVASALLRFENGVQGIVAISRVAWGRKNHLAFEVHGDKGMLCFDQERMNELRLYRNTKEKNIQGFQTILAGPEHPPYGNFCPAPGHGLGFNDLKTIEAAYFLQAIADGGNSYPDFADAVEFEKIIHAIAIAARTQKRVYIADLPA